MSESRINRDLGIAQIKDTYHNWRNTAQSIAVLQTEVRNSYQYGELLLKRAVIQKRLIIFPNYNILQRIRFNSPVGAVRERKRDIMLTRWQAHPYKKNLIRQGLP